MQGLPKRALPLYAVLAVATVLASAPAAGGSVPAVLTPTPAATDAAARYALAREYADAHNGLVLLVVDGDATVFEAGRLGYDADTPYELFSGTKSFACAMAVAAVADGLLSSLDERAAATLTEFAADAGKAQITVRQLLNFTSGLDPGMRPLDGESTGDRYADALRVGMVAAPGARFAYGPSHLFAFGELMRRKLEPLGEDPLDYLKRRVFAPIGLEVYAWRRDAAGNPYLPSGAFLSARAWARYGVLLRDGGAWAGALVLPAAQLAECFAGSDANPGYGLTFWLNHDVPEAAVTAAGAQGGLMQPGYLYEGGPPDLVMAAGAGNQRMYIIPSRDLVVVRFGWNDPSWNDAAFLARLLEGRVSD